MLRHESWSGADLRAGRRSSHDIRTVESPRARRRRQRDGRVDPEIVVDLSSEQFLGALMVDVLPVEVGDDHVGVQHDHAGHSSRNWSTWSLGSAGQDSVARAQGGTLAATPLVAGLLSGSVALQGELNEELSATQARPAGRC